MLEQMYTDFTTKLLPDIQAGLVISKEYFLDLFGRYVQYLIVVDIIFIVFGLILMTLGIISLRISVKAPRTGYKWTSGEQDWGEFKAMTFFIGLSMALLGLVTFICKSMELIKVIYVPELRIYQEIQLMK